MTTDPAQTQFAVPTYPEYVESLAAAEDSVRRDGGFVDPSKMRRYQSIRRGRDWHIAILGHANQTSLVEMHMLLIADEWDIDPPMPEWLAEQRAAQGAKRAAEQHAYDQRICALNDAWAAVTAALPVRTTLAYNYSGPNHYETYTQGAVHIILLDELLVGRLHRVANWALCTTDSTSRHQDFPWPDAGGEHGWPSCKACIRTAGRLTGLDVTLLLTSR